MSVAAQDGAAVLPVNQRQIMGAVVASCMGWALDLFDLFVLLYVAPVVGRLFFPSEHAMLSLAAVYASFAVTLLMRPLGSALFGSYADRHGRKGAMIVAVVGVGMSTAAFGLRFSNLTHRGIITNGPYRWTKHPAYIAKNLSWWLISVPFIAGADWLQAAQSCLLLAGVNLIYLLRAKTEERHLSRDPVYRDYVAFIAREGLLARLSRRCRLTNG